MDLAPQHFNLTVTPAAIGSQLVRVALPLSTGLLSPEHTFIAATDSENITTATRVLTWHPDESTGQRWARRALITFPFEFKDDQPVQFTLRPAQEIPVEPNLPVDVHLDGEEVVISYNHGPVLKARMIAPAGEAAEPPQIETVESNQYYLWQRYHFADPLWPREIEVRADALGGVAVVAHLRRDLPGDDYAPDFGWDIDINIADAHLVGLHVNEAGTAQSVTKITEYARARLLFGDGQYQLYHPMAPFTRRGHIELRHNDETNCAYRYFRCTREEKVPMQQASLRRAEFIAGPSSLAPLTATLESPHETHVGWQLWDALYQTGAPLNLTEQPELEAAVRYHHDATVRTMVLGDDWGNITMYSDGQDTGDILGMNRLNHCMPIFREGYRSGNRRLVEIGVLWCRNFYDQTIWWGPGQTGGTRYNNQRAMELTPPDDDHTYMWRSNGAVSFCTKGFASFFYAYEQTGDPRMKEALDAQVNYACQYLTAGLDYTRNVGVVHDFLLLYRFTGEKPYLDAALRLFHDLRAVLSTGDLFTESGRPIVADPPFIDDDNVGPRYPFTKPYIIGYALEGLPELAEHLPQELKLRDVVRAVADFLVEAQDAVGGWRYPHPRSSYLYLSQAMEHAWHLVQAAGVLGPQESHLDVIERILRQRLLGLRHVGKVFTGVTGWEISSGLIKEPEEIYTLYQKPDDRDFTLDYRKGNPVFGSSAPEGIVYFTEVLAFYLKHRDAERLLAPVDDNEPLGQILSRVEPVTTDES